MTETSTAERPTMSLFEAEDILESIGYDSDWTEDQLIAAIPEDMIDNVAEALKVSSAANKAEAEALRAYRAAKFGPPADQDVGSEAGTPPAATGATSAEAGEMTLQEAEDLLDEIGFDDRWTTEQLIAEIGRAHV